MLLLIALLAFSDCPLAGSTVQVSGHVVNTELVLFGCMNVNLTGSSRMTITTNKGIVYAQLVGNHSNPVVEYHVVWTPTTVGEYTIVITITEPSGQTKEHYWHGYVRSPITPN